MMWKNLTVITSSERCWMQQTHPARLHELEGSVKTGNTGEVRVISRTAVWSQEGVVAGWEPEQ
jgi:hypothetical protein